MLKNKVWLGIVATFFLILTCNPFGSVTTPEWIHQGITGVFALVLLLLLVSLWREPYQDEREAHHELLSGRVAFLLGALLVTLGIVVQIFSRTLDWWLPLVLVGMLGSKIFSAWYLSRKC